MVRTSAAPLRCCPRLRRRTACRRGLVEPCSCCRTSAAGTRCRRRLPLRRQGWCCRRSGCRASARGSRSPRRCAPPCGVRASQGEHDHLSVVLAHLGARRRASALLPATSASAGAGARAGQASARARAQHRLLNARSGSSAARGAPRSQKTQRPQHPLRRSEASRRRPGELDCRMVISAAGGVARRHTCIALIERQPPTLRCNLSAACDRFYSNAICTASQRVGVLASRIGEGLNPLTVG